MQVGDLAVLPLSDGLARIPRNWFANAEWTVAHDPLFADGGAAERAGVGRGPEEIDVVVCSHLHFDHAGWLVEQDDPVFPNATVRFGAADWRRWVLEAPEEDRIRHAMLLLDEQGRLEPIGRRARRSGHHRRAAPGHTEGHTMVVLASGEERAMLLGDAVTCPLQLTEEDWDQVSDMDRRSGTAPAGRCGTSWRGRAPGSRRPTSRGSSSAASCGAAAGAGSGSSP